MTRMIRLLLLSLAAVALLAACSGASAAPSVASLDEPDASVDPGASPSASAPTDPREAFVAYAACMREHGVDMPDPQVSDEGGGKFSVGFRPARAAPRPTRTSSRRPTRPAGRSSRTRSARASALSCRLRTRRSCSSFARCMREHGIDMPDPGEGGVMSGSVGPAMPKRSIPRSSRPPRRRARTCCRAGSAVTDPASGSARAAVTTAA